MNQVPTRAFTLIELLVVVAIIGVIASLVTPAAIHIQGGMNLTRAGQLVQGQLSLARLTAASRNRSVEVRFYATPGSTGTATAYRACQTYVYDEKGANPQPLDKLASLPTAVVITTEKGYSTLLDAPTRTGTQKIPGIGTGDYAFKGFRFRGGGSTDLDPNGPGGSNTDTWSLTLSSENDPASASAPPRNFYTVQVDPLSGVTTYFRP